MSDYIAIPLRVSILCGLCALLLLPPQPASAAEGSDPMRPPSLQAGTKRSGGTSASGYHLSSILIAAEHRSAIINGRNVALGDRIGSARVSAISATQVTLSIGGSKRVLTLLPLSIKKPAEASPQ